MKPLLASLTMLIMVCCECISQQPERLKHPQTRADYLEKSRQQNTGAWILLGSGVVGIAAIAPGNASFGTAGTVAVLSTAAILGSVPIFLAAHRNKRKAMRMSAHQELDMKLDAISNSYSPKAKW